MRLCKCGCGKPTNRITKNHAARGYVIGEYYDYLPNHHKKQITEERFWAKVDTSGECWVWTAGKCHGGHGQFTVKPHPPVKAHRWLWESVMGELSPDIELHHKCENPACVRTDHLVPLTKSEHNKLHWELRRQRVG